MSGWLEETRADLKDAEERIVALVAGISGEPTPDQLMSAWRAYVDLEKSVVFIKVEIDEENPGRFIRPRQYAVPDERQALQFALRNLRKGLESLSLGDYSRSLREVREARNYLRVMLKSKGRGKVPRRA